ncbi:MAG TPA: SHOCT domain-containing protein [Ktedonobacterales bacterium]|nr:SHOCT domain-containing protein [Ktedonobacterales bacterium]
MRSGPFFPAHFSHFHGFGGPFWWPHLLGFGLMSLFWLGLLGLLIWTVVHLASRRSPVVSAPAGAPGQAQAQAAQAPWQPGAAAPASELSATEILRQRYARGEIDAVTFQQMLERLQASNPSSASPPAESAAAVDPVGFGDHPTVRMDPLHPEDPADPTEGAMV